MTELNSAREGKANSLQLVWSSPIKDLDALRNIEKGAESWEKNKIMLLKKYL